MVLSDDLITQFAKITNDREKRKTETTVYGEVSIGEDGLVYVKFDGSNLLTRVGTTVDVKNKDRVAVLLKNHTATITGNITSPAARLETVQILSDDVEGWNVILDGVVTEDELDVERNRISKLETEMTTVKENLSSVSNTVSGMSDLRGLIEGLSTQLSAINDRVTAIEKQLANTGGNE